jgi:hypothetical protein
VFLHNVTCFSNKNINKYFNNILDDTNDVSFSLNNFLNFNLIKNYLKSHIFPYMNETILNITFKFIVGLNMQLIFGYFMHQEKSDD